MSRADHAMVVRDSIEQQRRSGAGAPDIWGMSGHVAPQPAWGPGGTGLSAQLQGGLPAIGPTQQVPTYLRQQMVARAITPVRQPMGDPAPVPAWGSGQPPARPAAIPVSAEVPAFLEQRRLVPDFRPAASTPVVEAAMALGGESAARATNPERLNQAMGVADPWGEGTVPQRPVVPVSGGVSTASADLVSNATAIGSNVAADAVIEAATNRGMGGGGGRMPRRIRTPGGASPQAAVQAADVVADVAAAAAPGAGQYGWARTLEGAFDLPRPVAAAEAALARHASNTALQEAAPRLHALTQSAGKLGVGAMRWALPAAGTALALAPAVTGAMEGYEAAGAGGAAIQGGSALAGAAAGAAIGSVVPVVGTVVGAGIGATVGSLAGGGLRNLAVSAVDAAQSGDSGLMGSAGRLLDPIITSATEKQQAEIFKQINSPAAQAIKAEEERRRREAQNDQMRQALMNYYLT